jgi:hypothetical protein
MIAEKIKATQGISSQSDPHRVVPAAARDSEVPAKAARRRFTAEYKLRILKLADGYSEPGSLGALLRRDEGTLSALTPKKRGRKEVGRDPLRLENEKLRKENERLTKRLRHAEIIIDVQKKVSQMLGVPLRTPEEGGTD